MCNFIFSMNFLSVVLWIYYYIIMEKNVKLQYNKHAIFPFLLFVLIGIDPFVLSRSLCWFTCQKKISCQWLSISFFRNNGLQRRLRFYSFCVKAFKLSLLTYTSYYFQRSSNRSISFNKISSVSS